MPSPTSTCYVEYPGFSEYPGDHDAPKTPRSPDTPRKYGRHWRFYLRIWDLGGSGDWGRHGSRAGGARLRRARKRAVGANGTLTEGVLPVSSVPLVPLARLAGRSSMPRPGAVKGSRSGGKPLVSYRMAAAVLEPGIRVNALVRTLGKYCSQQETR